MGQQGTESHEADELLARAQRMDAIGRLAPGVAHELNNSLAAILAFGQLLGSDERLPGDLRRDAGLLLQEADRTRRLIQNILDFLRQRPPERHPTKLGPLVASVIELEAYALSSAGIAVDVDIPSALAAVPMDRAAMQQVVLNLTLDAIEAVRSAGQPGRIAITASDTELNDAPAVRLAISDGAPRGRGADAETIGLRVAASIVAAHGGVLADEPHADGTGRRRAIILPLQPEEDEPAHEPEQRADVTAAAGRTGDRILIIDDEPAIREFVARVLRRAGHEPVLAGDGAEAVDRVRTEPVAAVLCDYRLPAMSGSEVHAALLEVRPELLGRIAFMTGDVLDPDFADFVRRHDLATLAKPFDIESVRAVVDEIVRDGRGARGARDQSRG